LKIAVECQSPLLKKSLEIFLSNNITTIKQCDIVIRDIKCINDERCFYISSDSSADLIKPFSSPQLYLALENRYKTMKKIDVKEKDFETPINFDILEKRIELLTREYQQNILTAVRAFYEK